MGSIYAEADIFEYWIFNLNSFCVEVYTKPHRGRYSEMKTYFKEDSLSPQFDPKIKLELSSLFL
jgi:Uma2 family endonuclease